MSGIWRTPGADRVNSLALGHQQWQCSKNPNLLDDNQKLYLVVYTVSVFWYALKMYFVYIYQNNIGIVYRCLISFFMLTNRFYSIKVTFLLLPSVFSFFKHML